MQLNGFLVYSCNRNYNSKREDLEEEDQGEDERNVILKEKRRDNYKLNPASKGHHKTQLLT